jgi:hypothetical protein
MVGSWKNNQEVEQMGNSERMMCQKKICNKRRLKMFNHGGLDQLNLKVLNFQSSLKGSARENRLK